jgi:hypothetical protein
MTRRNAPNRSRRFPLLVAGAVAMAFVAVLTRHASAAQPPGHPTVAATAQEPAGAPEDVSAVDPSLAAGTILVEVRGPADELLPATSVTLRSVPRSPTKAGQHRDTIARTDGTSTARFTGLDTSDAASYEISAASVVSGASSALGPFDLDARHGQRVRLHLFPASNRLDDARIAIQGVVYAELEDEALGVDVFFQVFNLGRVTWRPSNVVVDLPQGFSALQVERDSEKPGFDEVAGIGAKLRGPFPPGQRDAQLRFKIPYSNDGSLSFTIRLPPHVGRLRVVSEAAAGMQLSAAGFPDPVVDRDRSGRRILSTDREVTDGDHALENVTVTLHNVPGSTRASVWLFGTTVAIMLAGIFLASRTRAERDASADLELAKSRLAEEIAALDEALAQGLIGTLGHERIRRLLLNALGQILT